MTSDFVLYTMFVIRDLFPKVTKSVDDDNTCSISWLWSQLKSLEKGTDP